ncbi:DUF805 domain-containing protein [Shewanella surugensis]|uniref:DUF805 domain-containing protein n=1 Tax=Shewanella surugensis TaxID=212020 RepID=A0ABT0LA92_9GAMM|nr:hypothetical protein [Shewanella surugensis]MCL1124637.1 hypothetical protein [Shewanella surugensis]
MQFISLWCVKGCDNGLRSAVITGVIYFIVLLISFLLGPTAWLYFVGLLLAPILLFSNRRRLRDADHPGQWSWLSLLPFVGVIATLVNISNEVLLLIFVMLAVCIAVYFSSLKADRKRVYLQGYNGPEIKMQRGNSGLSQNNNGKTRVEPTLSADLHSSAQTEEVIQSELTSESVAETETSITANDKRLDEHVAVSSKDSDLESGEALAASTREHESVLQVLHAREPHIRESYISTQEKESDKTAFQAGNKRFSADGSMAKTLTVVIDKMMKISIKAVKLIKQRVQHRDRKVLIGGGIGVITFVLLVIFQFTGHSDNIAPSTATVLPEQPIVRHEAKLPDGFSLVFEDSILIMRWLGETQAPQTLWSLASAKGDQSCSVLTFNNGAKYRPLSVAVLADTAIEARFSPLDNAGIITDVAKRGSVSLCGYKFSLKGSLAVLGKNPVFGDYL